MKHILPLDVTRQGNLGELWKFIGCGMISLMGALILSGCTRQEYTSSKLPEKLVAESLVLQAGAAQGAKILERHGGGSSDPTSVEEHRQYSLEITSGTAGQLVSNLRAEMERVAGESSDTLFGTEMVAPGELRDFAFRYSESQRKGVVRVYSEKTGTNTVRVILFCYEHRK